MASQLHQVCLSSELFALPILIIKGNVNSGLSCRSNRLSTHTTCLLGLGDGDQVLVVANAIDGENWVACGCA